MDDLFLKSRIDDALERQFEPVRPEIADILAVGRRARQRRTAALSALTVAAVAAVALGTAWLATSGLTRSESDSAEMASDSSARPAGEPTTATEEASSSDFVVPRTDAEVTSACRRASYSSTAANTLLFVDGRAELVANASNQLTAWALFESRDGTLWGKCEIRKNLAELAVFPTKADDAPPDHYVRTGLVCGGGDCLTEARLTVKLPPEVAEVMINFADHDVLIEPTTDGWVAMTHLLELQPGQPAVTSVTYFGATGRALAQYADASLAEHLPPLTDYPALSEDGRLNFKDGSYTD